MAATKDMIYFVSRLGWEEASLENLDAKILEVSVRKIPNKCIMTFSWWCQTNTLCIIFLALYTVSLKNCLTSACNCNCKFLMFCNTCIFIAKDLDKVVDSGLLCISE